MLFPITIDKLEKPMKIPKFVALVCVVQSAIKIAKITTFIPASVISNPMIAKDPI